jgi:hypothetical protein
VLACTHGLLQHSPAAAQPCRFDPLCLLSLLPGFLHVLLEFDVCQPACRRLLSVMQVLIAQITWCEMHCGSPAVLKYWKAVSAAGRICCR